MVRLGRSALVALLTIAYYALLYHASVTTEHHWLSVLLALVPVAGMALFVAWKSPHRYPLLAAVAIVVSTVWWLLSDLIVENYMWFYLLQHAGINIALAIFFGRTLLGGQTALITRFAAIVHPDMPPEQTLYTRQVTLAWTLYFTGVALVSITLFLFAPIEVWSFFANILYLPMLITMFAVEYMVRLRCLPHVDHVSLVDTFRITSRYYREKHQRVR